ncbi:hypothetical protein BG74_07475 [Sodalis-like endosymbiont of Proechinophthirus fluctus]|uniref:hypothetical protein n=1 Tax=Sodalis-like endosymbiont of Proechinophthirus fluctus TaxID=1462730 RepID=UPI0007A84A94|nr:hypothetical protein [Sodalis-like endosymbiont of Proechinophthirus fluctus]KYP96307.1 hypothetical protein BG74_07475 [Sodalis-like endosymbiont of Proechinophthirus fluctus]
MSILRLDRDVLHYGNLTLQCSALPIAQCQPFIYRQEDHWVFSAAMLTASGAKRPAWSDNLDKTGIVPHDLNTAFDAMCFRFTHQSLPGLGLSTTGCQPCTEGVLM